ncbi:MAG: sulfotransferase [Caldilineaceae bacterium]
MVDKPIIIVGTGRCGSTIFQQVVCEHERLAWLSAMFDYYAGNPSVNRLLLGAADLPGIGAYLRKQKFLRPWEPYPIWEQNCPGFKEPHRDLRADDVTPVVKKKMQKAAAALVTPKRDRLLIKITGWPRIGLLQEIFPDAKFIHIVRDGRAVVNSLLNVDWWSGWGGPDNWRWGTLTPAQRAQWESYNRSFVALASLEWNILMDAMRCAQHYVPAENFMEIRYEDFCDDTVGITKSVMDFCELDWSATLATAVATYNIRNTNYKWEKELTPPQQEIMNNIMGPYLRQYHYL